MNTYSLIENWLSQEALAENVANSPDADGLWRLPYGRITLSLGVPEQADSFILYVPLMSVTGADETARAAFYQYLLHLQLKGTLPMGMTFGMDLDDTLVGMVGQFAVAGMDMRSFDNLLSEVASSADALYEQLQSGYIPAWHMKLSNGEHCAAISTKYDSRWLNFYVEGVDYFMKEKGNKEMVKQAVKLTACFCAVLFPCVTLNKEN